MTKDLIKKYTKLLNKWQTSNLSKTEFCRIHNFSLTTFYEWSRRLNFDSNVNFEKGSNPVKFLPITIKNDYQEKLSNQITIQVKHYLIALTEDFNYGNLKAILEIIDEL